MRKIILIVLVIVAAVLLFVIWRADKNIAIAPQASQDDIKKVMDDVKSNQQNSSTISNQSQADNQTATSAQNNQSNDQKTMELKIQTSQPGTGDRVVKAGDTISVLYTGKLTDGTVFDASSKHGNQPFDFQVGAGMVIKGWDQGLLGAKVGEKRTLTIPGDLAYGPQGIPGVIPPNATLVFDVEVLSIK